MLDPTFLVLALLAVTGLGNEFLFRTLPQDLSGFSELPTRFIRSVHALNNETIMVTTGAGIGISEDNGATFSIRTMQAGLPSNNVRASAVTTDGTIYALTYGETARMAMSDDGGHSFQDISASLPDFTIDIGVYRQAYFASGKRVFLLLSDGRLYYNTDSQGGPFNKVQVIDELGLAHGSPFGACETSNGDIIIGISQSLENSHNYSFARLQMNGKHYALWALAPSDATTTQYLQRAQTDMACFTRNGLPEVALTRLDSILAFLQLSDNQVTFSHDVEIPTGSNPGDQPIYPTVRTRGGSLFVVGYPVVMKLLLDANGKEIGFTSLPLNSNPNSSQNQINDISVASNGDFLVATAWGWFRCDASIKQCNEIISKRHGFYDSGVLDQNDQGFIFPQTFLWTDATNASATNPLFYSDENSAWTLDPTFLKPVAFVYPDMDTYSVQNAMGRGNRLAVMVYNRTSSSIVNRVLYVDNGAISSVDLPFASQNMFPQIRHVDEKGERVFIDTEKGTYVAEFGGNFTALNSGPFSTASSMYSSGDTFALTSDQNVGSIALSMDRGKTFAIVSGEKLGIPKGTSLQLGSYRGFAIAAAANALYQLSFAPLHSKKIFAVNSTENLFIAGSSDAGIWLDFGPPANSNSRPHVITSSGACYRIGSTNGFSGNDDFMAFIAGSKNSTLYFAGPNGVVQLQQGFNKTADCGFAQLP